MIFKASDRDIEPLNIGIDEYEVLHACIRYVIDHPEMIGTPNRQRYKPEMRFFGENENNHPELMILENGRGKGPTLEGLKTYSGTSRSFPAKYVECCQDNPDYSDLDQNQMNFFKHWRGEFFSGRFIDTDSGYFDLLLTELINRPDSRKHIKKLIDIYDYDRYQNILEAYDNTYGSPEESFNKTYNELFEGKISRIHKEIIENESGREISDKEEFVFSYSLKEISEKLKRNNSSFSEYFSIGKHNQYTLEDLELNFYGNLESITPDYRGSQEFLAFIKDLISCITNIMENRENKLKYPSINLDYHRLVRNGIDEFERSKIKLDLSEISKAEEELRCVTELMMTDEIESEEEPPEYRNVSTRESQENTNPWELFISKLDVVQKNYLGSILTNPDSKTRPVLSLEERINEISLETIGDVVVDGGTIIEEYLEPIKELIIHAGP